MTHKNRRCARCGLTFETRYAWAHHGCERSGWAGRLSEFTGPAVRLAYPSYLGGPPNVERAREDPRVRGFAARLANQSMIADATRPIFDRIKEVTATMARQLTDTFRAIEASALTGQPRTADEIRAATAEAQKTTLTLDDFLAFKDRFQQAVYWDEAPTIRSRPTTAPIGVEVSPVPKPAIARPAKKAPCSARRIRLAKKARARKNGKR